MRANRRREEEEVVSAVKQSSGLDGLSEDPDAPKVCFEGAAAPPLAQEPPPPYVPRGLPVSGGVREERKMEKDADLCGEEGVVSGNSAKGEVEESSVEVLEDSGEVVGAEEEAEYEAEYAELSDGGMDDEDLLREYQGLLNEDSPTAASVEDAEKEKVTRTVEVVNEEDTLVESTGLGFDDLTDEDMLDHESLAELDAVPSKEVYDSRVAANKKIAVQYKKAGNIEKAKEHLRMSKALQNVCIKLYGGEVSEPVSVL